MNSEQTLADVRKDYSMAELSEHHVLASPLQQLEVWLHDASTAQALEHTAMTLATVDADNKPSARVVLLKGIDSGLVFYTNYASKKGNNIAENNNVAAVFFLA